MSDSDKQGSALIMANALRRAFEEGFKAGFGKYIWQSEKADQAWDESRTKAELPGPGGPDFSLTGLGLVAAARRRQVEDLGWTLEHDQKHTGGEMLLAACCYAAPVRLYRRDSFANGVTFCDPWPWTPFHDKRAQYGDAKGKGQNWPPDPSTYNFGERLDLLTKSAALIVAEIDRLLHSGKLQRGPNDNDFKRATEDERD